MIPRSIRIYACQIWSRSDCRVEKKGGTDTHTHTHACTHAHTHTHTHTQTDKGTLQLYIVGDQFEIYDVDLDLWNVGLQLST